MQVKKFEAQSMKEALEMVKTELGPEAVILNAKDLNGGLGVLKRSGVEVTAAISELQLKKKKLAESKLSKETKAKFSQSPAKNQKNYIDKVVNKFVYDDGSKNRSNMRYIDIEDDPKAEARSDFRSEAPKTNSNYGTDSQFAKVRVKQAVQSALKATQSSFFEKKNVEARREEPARVPDRSSEVDSLKNLVASLQQQIELLKSNPQPSNNFSAPGYQKGVPPELSFMYEKLNSAGLADEVILQILHKAKSELSLVQLNKRHLVDAWVAKYILADINVAPKPFENGIHIFLGPPGQGKTSSLVKMASQVVIKEKKKAAILSTDIVKVGAADQLRIYSQILNVPFGIVRAASDWTQLLTQLNGVDVILVDFPGLTLRNEEETAWLKRLIPETHRNTQIHYVQSVATRDIDANEMGHRYKKLEFSDVIFTDIDESSHHGLIYNFQKTFNCPIHSFGIGPLIPEDFEVATRERVLDLLFKISASKI